MGPYNGGQAEALRLPYGTFNCLQLPPGVPEKQNDYVMVANIFPTGYHTTQMPSAQPSVGVMVYGAARSEPLWKCAAS